MAKHSKISPRINSRRGYTDKPWEMAQIAIGFLIVAGAAFGVWALVAFVSQAATWDCHDSRPAPPVVALHAGRFSQKPIASAVSARANADTTAVKLEPRYIAKAALLSPAERSFFGVLQSVLPPQVVIFPKVRLGDIIEPREHSGPFAWSARQTSLNKIIAKHIDFVLCDAATTKVLCAVELDDKSHNRVDRRTRDHFVDAALEYAAIPVVRIRAAHSYVPESIRRELVKAGITGQEPSTRICRGPSLPELARQDDSKYMPPMALADRNA